MSDSTFSNTTAIAPLFVPATNAPLIAKAIATGTDAVIADFEDSVAAGQRPSARTTLGRYLDTHTETRLILRVNNTADALPQDLAFAARYSDQIAAIMLPKVENTATISQVAALDKPVWGLVESPAGLFALRDIAAAPGLVRLGFGGVDFAQETGADPDSAGGQAVLDHVRIQLVLHSAAAGLAPPVNSPYPHFKDSDGLEAAARRVRGMGFSGMLCIHPDQVSVVQQAFAPTAEQRAWAERVVAAAREHDGAFQIDGEMIDAPVLARAERLLRAAPGLA